MKTYTRTSVCLIVLAQLFGALLPTASLLTALLSAALLSAALLFTALLPLAVVQPVPVHIRLHHGKGQPKKS